MNEVKQKVMCQRDTKAAQSCTNRCPKYKNNGYVSGLHEDTWISSGPYAGPRVWATFTFTFTFSLPLQYRCET